MKTGTLDQDIVKQTVRERYGKIATAGGGCGGAPTCCTPAAGTGPASRDTSAISRTLGYSAEQTQAAPEGANLGLGCGNPQAIAALKAGETVLDLGSGAGFDSFLAARAVGPTGRVIGVDMTPEMVSKARNNKASGGYDNVEFRIGEIESLPVADATVDVIISNCVINLSPDKPRVFREVFRVLKSGGRIAVSDLVALADRLGISLSGAKSRVQRGRAQLKEMLDECCTFEFDRRGKVIDSTPRAQAGCKERAG